MLKRALVLDRGIEAVAGILLIALLGCVTLGVITRALNDPLIWTDEIARFLMVFGWILASRRRTHVRIRFFADLLPRPARRVAEFVIQTALLIFGVAVAVTGVGLTARNFDLEATTVPISFAWMYAPMVLAGAVTAGQALSQALEICRRGTDWPAAGESTPE